MGPLTDTMKRQMREQQGDIKYDIEWTTLGEYLDHLVRRGVSCNVASFVGATTVRVHEIGYADRPPTPEELERMQQLVREAMAEGARGHLLRPDLRAGLLREDRGADRPVPGRRRIRRPVHLAHPQREQPAARSRGRADPHRPRGPNPRRDLPPQSRRPAQLAQARRADPEDRGRPRRGARHHRRHVYLHRRRHRARRRHAALGPGRRPGGVGQAPQRPRHPPAREARDGRAG